MRNMLVPHEGQTPRVAGLPFLMVTALEFSISFLDLHFTQYASISKPHTLQSLTIYIKRGEHILFIGGLLFLFYFAFDRCQ
jgi:uncharacterized membrane protein